MSGNDRELPVSSETTEGAGEATIRSERVAPVSVKREDRNRRALFVIAGATAVLLLIGGLLVRRADGSVNQTPVGAAPRPVTVVMARVASYRDSRAYVGAVESWIEASIGPQYVSAYVQSVLVRPGDSVTQGQVLATLDCGSPSAASRAAEMQARSVDARRNALADESARVSSMLAGGFVSPNEAEQKSAQSSSEKARWLETRATALAASLDVRDCILKAPFAGEVAIRTVDPGAFVRPGTAIVSIVDRSTVRVTVDAPEKDFSAVGPSAPVEVAMLATGDRVNAVVSRRAPKADPNTRTVHFEVDVTDPRREYPTGTTAIVRLDVGPRVPATEIPLYAATQHEGKAKLFIVLGGVAHAVDVPVLGEHGGRLYLDPKGLPERAQVVTEGRAVLTDGDPVRATLETSTSEPGGDAGAPARGGGFGRPL
jgi:membrane fusion protein, multidrug efflux system